MSYTKGKWYWKNGESGTDECASLLSNNGEEICNFGDAEMYYPTAGTEPNNANKSLIAASPDLLNACELMIKAFDSAPKSWLMTPDVIQSEEVMRNAIKRAYIK